MYPELLHIGGLTLYTYGLVVAAAIIAGGVVLQRLLRRHGLDADLALPLVIVTVAGGFIGARLYWLAEHRTELDPTLHTLFRGAGFTWYGGVIGGVLAVAVFARLKRLRLGLLANLLAPALAVGYAIGRVACQLAGDGTYGRPSDLPWAMAYPSGMVPTSVRVQPTPVYETLTMLVVFAILYRAARKEQPDWYVFGWFLILSGIERFTVEFLRTNALWVFGLTPPQWFAAASVIIGVVVVLRTMAKGETLTVAIPQR